MRLGDGRGLSARRKWQHVLHDGLLEQSVFARRTGRFESGWIVLDYMARRNGVSETMRIHRFTCKNDHSFFINLNLPKELIEFVESLKEICCPICESKEINIHAQEIKVEVME